jgi:hypothetical protein
MKHTVLPNGNLEFSLDQEDDKEEILSWPLDEVGYRLLEACNLIGNGWDPVAPEWIGALTDAPIITDGATCEDDGAWIVYGRVWWFPNYMVESPYETLCRTGRVIFTFAPVTERQRQLR